MAKNVVRTVIYETPLGNAMVKEDDDVTNMRFNERWVFWTEHDGSVTWVPLTRVWKVEKEVVKTP